MSRERDVDGAPSVPTADVVAVDLRTEDSSGLVATGICSPRLSWRLQSERRDVRQVGYEIQVGEQFDFSGTVHGSGLVLSSSPLDKTWPGEPLASRQVCWWRVRCWTSIGRTAWSCPQRVEAGLLQARDWIARPISPVSNVGLQQPGPVPLLRRRFKLDQVPVAARLYITALGVHLTRINGHPVSDELLEPGWSAYSKRLLYAAYDVTKLLKQGDNVISAAVGDGWWRGNLTWMKRRAVYGDTTALLAQLEMQLPDGTSLILPTDESWRGGTGALLTADIYDGVEMDLRREPAGWQGADFDDCTWDSVVGLDLPAGLELRFSPPVRVVQARRIVPRPTAWGTWLVDAGQNLVGYLRIRASGAAGLSIQVRHAEVLDEKGHLYTAALRGAKATDRYVLAGDPAGALLEPWFTFHGFRYAEITADAGVAIESVEVLVVSSDLTATGTFECSDERVNRLFQNVLWSQRGNFLSLPTDCPQRDERLGWTGDIQVFAPTACTNADARAFLASWLMDLALEQRGDGCVPSVVPNVIQGHPFEFGNVGWGDAASRVPWVLYEAYGDTGVLRRQFHSMCAWVDWCNSRRGSDGTWSGDFQLGDWLDPGAPPDQPEKATTSGDYIASAYLSYSAHVVARTAVILGDEAAASHYRRLGDAVAEATWRKWRTHAMTTQAGCAIGLELGIVPRLDRPAVGDALARLVQANRGRIATGFLGTPLVLPALTQQGHSAEAYTLLLNTECPGWLYQVLKGATTLWERWDAIKPDGGIHQGELASEAGASMMSFNHFAYGSVAQWLYRFVAGLAPTEEDPGYGTVIVAPHFDDRLTYARARVETPYGSTAISWVRAGGQINLDIEIATGAVGWWIPPPGDWRASAGGVPVAFESAAVLQGRAGYRLGSGRHALILHLA